MAVGLCSDAGHTMELLSRSLLVSKENKSFYFRVKLKRSKFKLYIEPDLDQT